MSITPFKGQSYDQIKSSLGGRLFEDPAFPATDSSLYYTQKPPRGIVWK